MAVTDCRRGLLDDVPASISLWVPAVVGAMGLIGTITAGVAGVLITQRRSDRREDKTWQRERERERDRWAREDAARTFELRREAYMEFYGAVSAQVRDFDMVHTWRERKLSSGNPREPSFDIELKVQEGQDKVRLYGSSVVVEVAEQIRSHLIRTLNALDDAEATAEHLVELALEEGALLRMIRADLGIPVGAIEVVGLY